MSARAVLQTAVRAVVAGADSGLTAVFDAPPVRAAHPFAVIEDAVLSDRGATGVEGRDGRIAVTLRDSGERPERLREIVAAVEAAVAAMPTDLGTGWRLVAITLARSRILRARDGEWVASSDFAVRMLRAG